MDSTRFPEGLGGDIGGKSFLELLENSPKIIEFVDQLWFEEKTTGLYKKFLLYIQKKLRDPKIRSAHQNRAREFVKTVDKDEVPSYMQKFCVEN